MNRPDYQGALGFELVTVELEDQMALHLIREDGADDRDATITERVLWSSLVETLGALSKLTNEAWPYLTAAQREEASAALRSNGWQA
jgi:hypothetical protein